MRKIYTSRQDKHKQQSFLHVAKTTGQIQEGETYTFIEYGNNNFIKQAVCVNVRTIHIEQLTPEISFLDQNCELDIFKCILNGRKIGKTDLLTIATFTDFSNIPQRIKESREQFIEQHYSNF